jgi:hypothetical protein
VLAAITSGALVLPSPAAGHPAYVDPETGSPGAACEQQATPCATIQEAVNLFEDGLPVIVDDSADAYAESVTLGDGKSLSTQDFAAEPAPGPTQWRIDGGPGSAVLVPASGAASISGFSLRGDAHAVVAQGPVNIALNAFDDPDQSANGDVDVLTPGPVSITLNDFADTDSVMADTAIRITGANSAASINRNRVSGYSIAVAVVDAVGPVTLSGDLLVSNGTGLALNDTAPTGPGEGDVSATNVTFATNATDVSDADAQLTLDSTIVEDPITRRCSHRNLRDQLLARADGDVRWRWLPGLPDDGRGRIRGRRRFSPRVRLGDDRRG